MGGLEALCIGTNVSVPPEWSGGRRQRLVIFRNCSPPTVRFRNGEALAVAHLAGPDGTDVVNSAMLLNQFRQV